MAEVTAVSEPQDSVNYVPITEKADKTDTFLENKKGNTGKSLTGLLGIEEI